MCSPALDLKHPEDVLIVGGGSAGAALAARLSEEVDDAEAHPNRRVLLLEAAPPKVGPHGCARTWAIGA
jgi:2-polyprenyl-6-methoxyphenol hydroxylase-like FAD-dependent oxidoreductase